MFLQEGSPHVSIGILAHNEGGKIERTLNSLFAQSLFAYCSEMGWTVEILCIVNGSIDTTAAITSRIFAQASSAHPDRAQFSTRVIIIPESGKMNAWNRFVHEFSSLKARTLVLMDADIEFLQETALEYLCSELEGNMEANAATGKPVKSIAEKEHPSIRERISLRISRMNQGDPSQLTGQLYCIRAVTARRIRMPLDLTSCDDGLIKALVCTDFGLAASNPGRIAQLSNVSHSFDAYVTASEVLRNQKRQMMAQSFLHLLLDNFLPNLSASERTNWSGVIERLEREDPNWLRVMMADHLKRNPRFWNLFPDVLTFRYKRLKRLPFLKKLRYLPTAFIGFCVTLLASWMAARALRKGITYYWPEKENFSPASFVDPAPAACNRPAKSKSL